MKPTAWLLREAKAFGVRTVYFLFCYGLLLLIKWLILEEYHVGFVGFGTVIIGALISAKVVIVVEHTPLARAFRNSPPIVKVLFETAFYGLLSLATLYTERAFALRHQAGGFFPAFSIVLHQNDRYLFAMTLIAVTLSFSFYSTLNVIDEHLGRGELLKLFLHAKKPNHLN